jgi:hypothetical protein
MRGPARVTGLGQGLSGGLARWRAPRVVHNPGTIQPARQGLSWR